MERVNVAVVGGGQAGLATSRELTVRGIEHVVFERGDIGQTWRGRWDTFCLVTPNWSVQLPGHPYDGDDPDGFMPRDEIVAYLERYAESADAPVLPGVDVTAVRTADAGFELTTSSGSFHARSIVLATGAYQRPFRPAGAEDLPPWVQQIDVNGYTNPDALAPGKILIIGSGQSGCQLAEELHQAGREVFLACGRAPWVTRRLGGRDIVHWVVESGFFDATAASLPGPAARLTANVLATGHGGGHDLHLRTLQGVGVTLLGRFAGAGGGRARFAEDLVETIAWGDARNAELMDLFRRTAADAGLPVPEVPEPGPFDPRSPAELDLDGFGTVVFTGGFRPDYGALASWPGVLDGDGFPVHAEGASTAIPGLYFVGVHFLRKRKSSLLYGVGEDAAIVAGAIAAR
jgi:cation diffusion facilitator CzcD-associated flavoprotein CzcO